MPDPREAQFPARRCSGYIVSLTREGVSPALAARPATPVAIRRCEALRDPVPCENGPHAAGGVGRAPAGGDLWDPVKAA